MACLIDVLLHVCHHCDPQASAFKGACRFTVGLLSEMPPTDFMDDTRAVTCLLGLNINRGQEIKLRLRTNDLKVPAPTPLRM